MNKVKEVESEEYCIYCKRRGLCLTMSVCGECLEERRKFKLMSLEEYTLQEYTPTNRTRNWPFVIESNGQTWKFYNSIEAEDAEKARNIVNAMDLPVISLEVFRSERKLIGRLRSCSGNERRIESNYAAYLLIINKVFKRGVPIEI